MSDTLYLSLWYPNLRLAALAEKLTAVLTTFAAHDGQPGIYAATAWPVNWSETPVFQRVWGRGGEGIAPSQAVEETLELLHEDYAYEFQIGWNLWEREVASGLDPRWVRAPRLVRVTGFGPLFDEGAYEQDGHIRIDFGSDTPFLEEDLPLDPQTARHVEQNISQLIALTLAVEKESGATARLLWSELGESLAQRLAARLGLGELAVRFTIERIRTLVLVTAVLLVIAIGLFLGVAKFRRPFSRRDIPQRLGIDIQQEANGVTYTQNHGGHAVFKIHASHVVQLRNNHATLHDVVIELYGKDGVSVDRIQGSEFEYDQSTSIATAKGEVEIEMQRPPATTQSGTHPAPAPTKPNPNNNIKVHTSGITFNQGTGMVTTAQRVQFTTGQGSGSAVGATYDSDLGYLVLNSNVEMNTFRGSNPVSLHAAHAEFNRDEQICMLRQATMQSGAEQATAVEARVTLRSDGSVDRLTATQGLTVSTQAGNRVAAPTGQLEFTSANQPRHAHLEGGVLMDSTTPDRTIHGAAPTMDLDFDSKGNLQHAHLERGVEMQSKEQSQATQNDATINIQTARTWHSAVADVDFRPSAAGQVEPASLQGTGVVVTSETRRTGAAPAPSRLAADDVTAQFGPHSTLTSMSGQGHAAIQETAATGAQETATGDTLQAKFNAIAPAQPAAKSSTPSQLGQLQSAQLDGHVILIDRPAAKPGAQPQPPMRATAGRAFYETSNTAAAPEQWLHLTFTPRVTDGGIDMAADKIDVEQSSGDAFAHGNVKATWLNNAPTGQSTGAKPASLQLPSLGGNAPAHVIANEAEIHQSTGEAIFRGHARLWQDQDSISAPVIILNRQQQTLTAQAAGPANPVQSILLSAEPAPTSPASAPANTPSQHAPSIIRVRSGDLHYSAQDRKAILHAAPLAAVIAQTATAQSSSDQLELYLTPAPAPDQAASTNGQNQSQGQIDRVVALGHVALNSQGRHGTGTQLVYSAQSGNYVLTGTPTAPPRMTDPQRGTVTGESLIFNSRDDSVSIEGGTHRTTTQTTAPDNSRAAKQP